MNTIQEMGMSPSARRTGPDSLALLQQILGVSDSMVQDMNDILTGLGLTAPQVELLWLLGRGAPPMPMREVAKRLRCDPSNVTLISDRMQAAGLIVRQVHPSDGRQRVLALTEHGQQLWDRVLEHLHARSPIFTLTPAEQSQLSSLLAKVLASGATGPATRVP